MAWAELQIPVPSSSGNADLDAWLVNLVKHLRNYLGAYHDRGDPASFDFELGDLTTDATWRTLDLNSIVPSETKAVLVSMAVLDNATSSYIYLRKPGNSNAKSIGVLRTQVSGVWIEGDYIVSCVDQSIEYYGKNLTFTGINITVKGWWK